MMKALQITPLIALTVLMAVLALPAHGQTGIIIDNADTVRQEGVSLNAGLSSATSSVGPRIVLQYANTKREERIAAPPADLANLLVQVSTRIVLQYANTMRQAALVAPPGELQSLFGQVAGRIILQYANTSRQMMLAYPVVLIGDTVPPQFREVRAQNAAGGVKITWTTDEFATGEVRYGTAPGTYPWVAGSRLYEKQHEVTLLGLTPGTTYYFVAFSIDRSGNQSATGEYQIQARVQTYLPTILRGR